MLNAVLKTFRAPAPNFSNQPALANMAVERIKCGGIALDVFTSDQMIVSHLKQSDGSLDSIVTSIVKTICETHGAITHLDIGSNYGLDLCLTAKLIRDNAKKFKIAGFDPGIAGLLTYNNICLNGLQRDITFLPVALGHTNGFLPLYREPAHSEDNRIVNHYANRSEPDQSAAVLTADSFMQFIGDDSARPVFLKIDTQGAEPEVFTGLKNTIATRPCVIISEYTPWAIATRHDPVGFLKNLSTDFTIYDIGPGRDRFLKIDDFKSYTDQINGAQVLWTDMLLLPKRHSELSNKILKSLDA